MHDTTSANSFLIGGPACSKRPTTLPMTFPNASIDPSPMMNGEKWKELCSMDPDPDPMSEGSPQLLPFERSGAMGTGRRARGNRGRQGGPPGLRDDARPLAMHEV